MRVFLGNLFCTHGLIRRIVIMKKRKLISGVMACLFFMSFVSCAKKEAVTDVSATENTSIQDETTTRAETTAQTITTTKEETTTKEDAISQHSTTKSTTKITTKNQAEAPSLEKSFIKPICDSDENCIGAKIRLWGDYTKLVKPNGVSASIYIRDDDYGFLEIFCDYDYDFEYDLKSGNVTIIKNMWEYPLDENGEHDRSVLNNYVNEKYTRSKMCYCEYRPEYLEITIYFGSFETYTMGVGEISVSIEEGTYKAADGGVNFGLHEEYSKGLQCRH